MTDTQASTFVETEPTGVSAPTDTVASVCEDTGAGADTSAVSVTVVFVWPCITPPTKTPPLPIMPVSADGTLDSPVESEVVVVDEIACSRLPSRLSEEAGADVIWVDPDEQPGLFTDTHASPVADTSPTGVSVPAEIDVFDCAETGTGAETSAVSVAVVFVPVVVRAV